MNLGERELIALKTLEKMSDLKFVLIGGYAVNAYVPPRFSVDCDLVVLGDLKEITSILANENYKLVEKGPKAAEYMRYLREEEKVSFDLMIGTVFDRLTGILFDKELFEKHSSKRVIVGKANPVRVETVVANPELLFAMKFVTARKQDIRDLFMLSGAPLDWREAKLIVTKKCDAILINGRTKLIMDEINHIEYRKSLEGAYGGIPDELFARCKERLYGFLEKF